MELSLERQAIDKARLAFTRLREDCESFQECIDNTRTAGQLVQYLEEGYQRRKNKASFRLLEKFQKHTIWLQNLSSLIDATVQAKAGLICPIWAPVKFVLQVSKFHASIAKQITMIIQTISSDLPQLEVYKLQSDQRLQIAFLSIFTDITEFCISGYRCFRRGIIVRLFLALRHRQEFQWTIDRLKSHAKTVVDSTFKLQTEMKGRDLTKFRLLREMWLNSPSMRDIHQFKSQITAPGTCEWICPDEAFQPWTEGQDSPSKDRHLCVSGKNGCGKSVLTSFTVEHLRQGGRPAMYFPLFGKDALEVFEAALVRLGDAETIAKYDILREIGNTNFGLQPYENAESAYRREAIGREILLGLYHFDTLSSIYRIGRALYSRKMYAEAKEMFQKAAMGMERLLGPGHFDTIFSLYYMGLALYRLRIYTEAAEMLQRAAMGMEKLLGPHHAITVHIIYWTGCAFYMLGKYAEAEELLQRAATGVERVRGPNNPYTVGHLYWTGITLFKLGKYVAADEIFQRVATARETIFGPDHADIISSRHWRGLLLYQLGRYAEAEEILQIVAIAKEKKLGSGHKSITRTIYWKGRTLYQQGKYIEAEEVFCRAASTREMILGSNHKDTSNALFWKGRALYEQGKYAEAKEMFQKVASNYKETLGLNDAKTINTMQWVRHVRHLESRQIPAGACSRDD